MKTLFTPTNDAITPIVEAVTAAQHLVRVCAFTFTLTPLIDALIARHQAGVDVALIRDSTQTAYVGEVPKVARLRAAGVPLLVGTSPKAHTIIHAKYLVADSTVIDGSMNFTAMGNEEVNVVNVLRSPTRAAQFLTAWQALHDWILANEPQPAATAPYPGDWTAFPASDGHQ